MECLRHNKIRYRAFTMIEVSVALIILGMIAATVLVIINKAVDTVVVWQTKMQAFEIVRENMEQILAKKSVSDMFEYGTSETNPDITWETTVESFYEPITNKMWVRAVCSAEFPDSNDQPQKIELTQWLTGLSEKQIKQILEQKQKLAEYQTTSDDANGANYQQDLQNQDSSQQNTQQQDSGTGNDSQNMDTTSDDPELQKALKELLGGNNGN
jgi:prepilin-type N-terminal cleavage/methylation domain-containing protein